MCVMRGLYFLCCGWGYTKFQITITVCQFHWEHGVFRGLLQWTEWILMPIISRYFNNISNIVGHWYLSIKLAQPSTKVCGSKIWHKYYQWNDPNQVCITVGKCFLLRKTWQEVCFDKGLEQCMRIMLKIQHDLLGGQPGGLKSRLFILFL